MDNLKKEPIEVGDHPKLTLSELLGEEFPEIEKSIKYSWKIDLKGDKKFTHVKSVKVVFKFSDESIVTIREIKPQSKEEEKGTFAFSPIPGYLSVSAPIKIKNIKTVPIPGGAECTFFGINLPDKPEIRLDGELEVEFLKGAENKEISVQMLIEPYFYRLKYWKWKEVTPAYQPRISYELVTTHTKTIKPYDRELGKPSSDKPGKERIQEYEWEIEEGILKKKPGIRNVALRTETFSLLLSYLQKKIPPEKYREVMRSAGFEIGVKFVENIECVKGQNFKFTLNEWRDYDSAAGMGRFEFKKNDEGKLQEIEIKNSFIAYDRCSNEPVCDFFCGYFEGGLGKIYGKRFIVTEEKCIAQRALSCVFEVREISNAIATAFTIDVEAFLTDFSDVEIDEQTNIEGRVISSGNYYGLSFFDVTNVRNKERNKDEKVRVYRSADCNITEGDYIYVIGIKTGPNEMIAYLIEKQTHLQKELNGTRQ